MDNKNKIVSEIVGGLGNQMFQIAVAMILGNLNSSELFINISFFKSDQEGSGVTCRKFELDIFRIDYKIASKDLIQEFNELSVYNRIRKRLNLNYPKIYREKDFSFDYEIFKYPSPIYLKGYFQSYKYFINYENFIKEKFSFPRSELGEKNEPILNIIKKEKSVSLHIRRGDYINNKKTNEFHGTCTVDYYLTAISIMAKKAEKIHLFFFSDDIAWVKKEFKKIELPKQFIDHNQDSESWKDMFLMSNCNHNIIANSSFSWWAAWLNTNSQKTVIAPKKWFSDSKMEKQSKDLLPPNWIRV